MKNFNRLVALVFLLFFASGVFARTAQIFNIYADNLTPFNIHLGNSYWNKTPFVFLTKKIPPFSTEKIAVGEIINNSAAIAFYAQVGEDPKNYLNTPVITYSFGDSDVLRIDPNFVIIDNKKYPAKLIHPSKDSNDIVLKLG